MSSVTVCPRNPLFALGWRPAVRWAGLLALLLAETAAINLRFDLAQFSLRRDAERQLACQGGADSGLTGPVVALLERLHYLPRFVLVAVAATLLLGGGRLLRELSRRMDELTPDRTLWAFCLAHLAAFAGYCWLTGLAVGSAGGHPAPPVALLATRFALGLLSLACWAAAALPPRLWPVLARPLLPALLAGCAVGALARTAGLLAHVLWRPLGGSTLYLVHRLLALVFPSTVCRPEEFVVGTPAFAVHIAVGCSGWEGIGLVWVFLGFYLWYFRTDLRFPHALLLLPAGTAAIWLANVVRIAALVAVGNWVSPEVATTGFHSQAGWLAFLAVALALVAATRRLRFFAGEQPPAQSAGAPNQAAGYLLPLLTLLATAMMTGAFSAGFDRFYPARVLTTAAALLLFSRGRAGLRWVWSWSAAGAGVLVFGLWMALEPRPGGCGAAADLPAYLRRLPAGGAAAWLAFRVLGSVVTVPLAEELAFRGYLTRRLLAEDFQNVPVGRFSWLSFLVSSALFGALHGRWLAGTAAGMGYALVLYRRRNLADSVLAHAVTNALIAAYVLTTGAWWLWT